MSEIVRFSTDHADHIQWPKRCPQCGEKDDLVAVESTAIRQELSYYLVALMGKTESVKLTFFSCRKHAFQNEFAIKIMRKTAIMSLLRFAVYMACLQNLIWLYQILRGLMPWSYYREHPGVFAVTGFAVFGILLILWASKAAAVLPLRLDADKNVIVFRFNDHTYARDFKRANPKATHKLLTQEPIFFMRKRFWNIVILVCIFVYFQKIL